MQQMTTWYPKEVFLRSSRERPEKALGMSRINLSWMSLGLGHPLDDQIGPLGDVLGTLDGDLLGTSW